MNNIENDNYFAQPWIAVKKRLIEKADVPEEHLKEVTAEQALFLDDLFCVKNLDAVRKLAENKDLMYTNPEINELFVTDFALFLLNHYGDPEDLPNYFPNDRDHLIQRFYQVGHFGDVDYWDHHEALERLTIHDDPVKTV